MTTPMRRTVSHKLVSVALLTTLVVLVLSFLALSAYMLRSDYQRLAGDLRIQSALIGHMTAPALAFHDRGLARENLSVLRLRPQVIAATLYDAQGRVFATYVAAGQEPRPPAPVGPDGVRLDGDALSAFSRIVQDKEMLGTLHLQVDHEFVPRLLGLVCTGALVTAAAMVVAWLLITRLHQTITAPILAIADIARSPEIRGKLLLQGWQAAGTTPEGLARRVRNDTAVLGGVILMRGIHAQ